MKTNLKDITKEWIRENFDIDKERKIKVKKHEYPVNCITEDYDFAEDLIVDLQDEINLIKGLYNPKKISYKTTYEYYDNDYPSFILEFSTEKQETDAQVIARLLKREKDKIKRKLKRLSKENREFETYIQLHKKYGNIKDETS